MADFASGKKALAICDICGFECKHRELKRIVENGRDTGILACRECYNPDHPQLKLGRIRVNDPQAIRNPRSDSPEWEQSRAIIIPAPTSNMVARVGQVTVTTT